MITKRGRTDGIRILVAGEGLVNKAVKCSQANWCDDLIAVLELIE